MNSSSTSANATMTDDIAKMVKKFLGGLFPGASPDDSAQRDKSQYTSYLPYRAVDTANNIFILKHGIGFVLEVAPQTGAGAEDEKLLSAIFRGWPVGTAIQIQMLGSPHFTPLLLKYTQLRTPDADAEQQAAERGRPARNTNPGRVAARKRFEYFQRGGFKSITRGFPWLLRKMRVVVSVSIPCDPTSPEALQSLLGQRESLESSLSASNYSTQRWDAAALINFTADLCNPNRFFTNDIEYGYEPDRELRDQIVDIATDQIAIKHGLRFSSLANDDLVDVRAYAIRKTPERFSLAQMAGLAGDALQGNLQYPCPYLITMGAVTLEPAATASWVTANQMRAIQNAGSSVAKYSPDMAAKHKDWTAAKDVIESGGEFLRMYHTLLLFARPDVMPTAERTAEAIWRAQGLTIGNISFMHRPVHLASLPLALSTTLEASLYKLRLSATRPATNAVAMSPLLGEWMGTNTPVLLLAGRRGQVAGFSLFDSSENYNLAIVGTSGSGKSSVLAELICSYLDTGAKIWTLDLGNTFKNLCDKRGGSHVEFSAECDININPFTHVVDFADDYEMLHAVIAKMASPLEPMTDAFQFRSLGEALTQTWATYGKETTITKIRDLLAKGRLVAGEQLDTRLTDLAMMLSPYCAGGPHAKYFDGSASIDFTNNLTVIEFEQLKRSPSLHKIAVMILLFRITSEMYFHGTRKKVFIVDELAQQLGTRGEDNLIAVILDEAARRARKYGGALVTASQEAQDYFDYPSLRTSWTLASHRMILIQKPEALRLLKEEKKISLTDYQLSLLPSLRVLPGAFAEMLLFTDKTSALVRLAFDPFAELLYSNRPQDNVPLRAKLNAGLTLDAAIEEILAERGGYAA